jgi:hypothetical protein
MPGPGVVVQRRLGELLGHDLHIGLGGLHEPEIRAVLVVKAAGHSAAELQPVVLERPHRLPLSVAWPGGTRARRLRAQDQPQIPLVLLTPD